MIPGIAEGCVDRFSNNNDGIVWGIYDPDYLGSGQPIVVAGLAADAVRSVSVVIDGAPNETSLKDNTFVFVADPSTVPNEISSLVVTYDDGTTSTIEIGNPPLPGPS